MKRFWIIIGAVYLAGCSSESTTQSQNDAPASQPPILSATRKPPVPTVSPIVAQKSRAAARQEARAKRRADARLKANAAFDVPSLLGKNAERVRAILGPPEDNGANSAEDADKKSILDDENKRQGQWVNHKKNLGDSDPALLVTFDPTSQEVTEVFVTTAFSVTETDKTKFLAMGNLKEGDPKYRIEYVGSNGSTTEFLGVNVYPKTPDTIAADQQMAKAK